MFQLKAKVIREVDMFWACLISFAYLLLLQSFICEHFGRKSSIFSLNCFWVHNVLTLSEELNNPKFVFQRQSCLMGRFLAPVNYKVWFSLCSYWSHFLNQNSFLEMWHATCVHCHWNTLLCRSDTISFVV